jgi:NAD/NADP transhydrogenase alpha subunit
MRTELCRINNKAEEESKMHIGVPAEMRAHETRVAAPPETVKKYVSRGHRVTIRSGAGTGAGVPDEAFSAVGAEIVDAAAAFGADLILKVQSPTDTELPHLKRGAVLVDLAAGRGPEYEGRRGGNCPLTEADKVVTRNDVQIVGYTTLASTAAADASSFYARNLLDFPKLIVNKEGALNIYLADDIVAATLLARDGEVTRKA